MRITTLNVPADLREKYERILAALERFFYPRLARKPRFLSRARRQALLGVTYMFYASDLWRQKSEAEKQEWKNAAEKCGLNGWQLYLKDKVYRLMNNIPGDAVPSIYHQFKVGHIKLVNMAPQTQHEFRAGVEWNGNRSFGSVLNFTTTAIQEPAVTTNAATGVKGTKATLNGEITTLGDEISVNVFFQYRKKGWEIWKDLSKQRVYSSGPFSQTITGLSTETDYEFRAVVEWDSNQKFGSILSFTTTTFQEPAVTTNAATGVKGTKATLNGEITDIGDPSFVNIFFQYRKVGAADWIETTKRELSWAAPFSETLTGLDPSTDYEFRAVVEWDSNQKFGSILSFTTTTFQEPAVTTNAATDVRGSRAILNGNLTDIGDVFIVYVFFQYRKVGATEWLETGVQELSIPTGFSETLTGLDPSTDYEFRAVVVWDDSEKFGNILSFTTSTIQEPAVTTETAINIKGTRAKLRGDLTSIGEQDFVYRYFQYREVGATEWIETDKIKDSSTGLFYGSIKGLTPQTDYEFRAVIEWNGNQSFGSILSFTTSTFQEPAVTTNAATDVKGQRVTLNGDLTNIGEEDSVYVFFQWRKVGATDWIETDKIKLYSEKTFYKIVIARAKEILITQRHPHTWWEWYKKSGKKKMYSKQKITEQLTFPFKIALSRKTNLTAVGDFPYCYLLAKIIHFYEGHLFYTMYPIVIPLVSDWGYQEKIIEAPGGYVGTYELQIRLNDVTGEMWFDNIIAEHGGTNFARDKYCDDITRVFFDEFFNVAMNWEPTNVPTGALCLGSFAKISRRPDEN